MSAPEPESILDDGWQATTPARDTILRDFVDSSVHYLVGVGTSVGAATIEDDDVAGAHHGAAFPFANMVIVRRPLRRHGWEEMIDRLRRAFPGDSSFVISSPFPTPDLRPFGFGLVGHPPFMVRPAGPPVTIPRPAGLEIEVVAGPAALADFERTLVEAYPAGPSGTLLALGVLEADDVTLWLARLDGRPVATAVGHHGGTLNGVEMISCLPDARGAGIGEAMTWAATLVEPDRPAALIASDPGRPVYARMGYLAMTRFTLWVGQ